MSFALSKRKKQTPMESTGTKVRATSSTKTNDLNNVQPNKSYEFKKVSLIASSCIMNREIYSFPLITFKLN